MFFGTQCSSTSPSICGHHFINFLFLWFPCCRFWDGQGEGKLADEAFCRPKVVDGIPTAPSSPFSYVRSYVKILDTFSSEGSPFPSSIFFGERVAHFCTNRTVCHLLNPVIRTKSASLFTHGASHPHLVFCIHSQLSLPPLLLPPISALLRLECGESRFEFPISF